MKRKMVLMFLMSNIFMLFIAPAVAGGLIAAGATLFGGILGSASAKERERQKRLHEAQQAGLQKQAEAHKALGAGQSSEMDKLVQSFRAALIPGGR